MNGTPPPVVLRGVSRTWREDRAPEGVDLDLAPDRVHGLVGRNGSGRTTLLSVIGQPVRPDRGGRVELFGRPGWEDPDALARTVLLQDRQWARCCGPRRPAPGRRGRRVRGSSRRPARPSCSWRCWAGHCSAGSACADPGRAPRRVTWAFPADTAPGDCRC